MNELKPIEQNNQRVLLTSQLAERYGTTSDVITKNYNRNKGRYCENKDFYLLQGETLKDFRTKGQIDLSPNLNKLYLWTEHGALLHAKSLGTDEAWEVYTELVNTYFRARGNMSRVPFSESRKSIFHQNCQIVKHKHPEQSAFKRKIGTISSARRTVDATVLFKFTKN